MRRILVTLLVLVAPAVTFAQQPATEGHRFTVGGGLIWLSGYPIGDRFAEIRRNTTGSTTTFTLFRADSEFKPVAGAEVRLGFSVTRDLFVEVAGAFARPIVQVSISQDAEADPISFDADRVSHYEVDVNAVYLLPLRLGSRIRPHVIGGYGYLRQLHEDRALVEIGRLVHLGGGAQVWLKGSEAASRALGIRAELLAVMRSRGIDFEDRRRTFPTVRLLGTLGCRKILCR